MNPWIALLDNPPHVTKEEIKRVQETKHLIKPSKRYNLPLKYYKERELNDYTGSCHP
jgi:hypothetical protein